MQSTRSYFNPTLFCKTMRRYWPMWASYLAIWLLILATYTSSIAQNSWQYAVNILELTVTGGAIISLVACCLAAMFVYSWMYNSRSAGAYSALPLKREGLFLSTGLAGIAPLIASNLLASLAAWGVGLAYGQNYISILMQSFAMISLFCLLFYGLATFCAVLTGHVFVLPAIYVIFNFLVYVVESLTYTLMELFVFGAETGATQLNVLSPPVQILSRVGFAINYGNGAFLSWKMAIIYAVVGILLSVAALFIFRRRKMETASDVVAVRVLRPVFKYCLCFGCALVLGIGIYILVFTNFSFVTPGSAPLYVCISMLIGGLIGLVAAEMLLKKSFRVFKTVWKGALVSSAVIILFVVSINCDLFGYETRVPDAESVSSVYYDVYGTGITFEDADGISAVTDIHRQIVENRSELQARLEDFERPMTIDASAHVPDERYRFTLRINYLLKNGKSLVRSYELVYDPADELTTSIFALANSPSAILSQINRLDFDNIDGAYVYGWYPSEDDNGDIISNNINRDFSGSEALELLQDAIIPDAADGSLLSVGVSGNSSDKVYCFIEIRSHTPVLRGEEIVDYNFNYVDLYLYDTSSDTFAALCEYFPELINIAQSADK